MNIISWILFGLLVGIVANAIDPQKHRGGLLGSILLGVGGALVGGLIANLFFGMNTATFTLSSFLVAVGGALFLLLAGRAMRRA